MMKDEKKVWRRRIGSALARLDQLNAAIRDLPRQIMFTGDELAWMESRRKGVVSNRINGKTHWWIGPVELRKGRGNIWIWDNPQYGEKKR